MLSLSSCLMGQFSHCARWRRQHVVVKWALPAVVASTCRGESAIYADNNDFDLRGGVNVTSHKRMQEREREKGLLCRKSFLLTFLRSKSLLPRPILIPASDFTKEAAAADDDDDGCFHNDLRGGFRELRRRRPQRGKSFFLRLRKRRLLY